MERGEGTHNQSSKTTHEKEMSIFRQTLEIHPCENKQSLKIQTSSIYRSTNSQSETVIL